MTYSFTKGLQKAALYTLTTAGTLIAFAGFSDMQIWDLVVEYIKPVLGSLTIGGAITMAINHIRFINKEG